MTPKISVIVPVYKVEKYLPKCIDSILAQTFTDFELLLIDDGSPDNSGAICDEYAKKDSRIRVFHKENGGVSSARNLGLDEAKGEWISFVDGDDTVDDKMLSTMYIESKCDNHIVICGMRIHEVDSSVRLAEGYDRLVNTVGILEYDQNNILSLLEYHLLHSPCDKLYNRSIIISNSLRYDTAASYNEDLLFNLDYFKQVTKVTVLPHVFYNYFRYQEGTSTGRYHPNLIDLPAKINSKLRLYSDVDDNIEFILKERANLYIRTLTNVFHIKSNLTIKEKYYTIDQILKSRLYQETLSVLDSLNVRGITSAVLKSSNTLIVYMYLFIRSI